VIVTPNGQRSQQHLQARRRSRLRGRAHPQSGWSANYPIC
jgi:hypothetical protein